MADPLIDIADLHAYYGEAHVLQGVSLRIAPGEAVGLLGRNGMGKTTFIRAMLRLMRATTGRITIRVRDCTGERPDRGLGGFGATRPPSLRAIMLTVAAHAAVLPIALSLGHAVSAAPEERLLMVDLAAAAPQPPPPPAPPQSAARRAAPSPTRGRCKALDSTPKAARARSN